MDYTSLGHIIKIMVRPLSHHLVDLISSMVCGTTAGGEPKNADRLHPGQTAFQALDSPAGIDFFRGTFRQRPMEMQKNRTSGNFYALNNTRCMYCRYSLVENPGGPYSYLGR